MFRQHRFDKICDGMPPEIWRNIAYSAIFFRPHLLAMEADMCATEALELQGKSLVGRKDFSGSEISGIAHKHHKSLIDLNGICFQAQRPGVVFCGQIKPSPAKNTLPLD